MKVKSLAVGMVLPLAASVALTTAPTASAATPTKATFNQTGVAGVQAEPDPRPRRGGWDKDKFDRRHHDGYYNRHWRNDYRRYGHGYGSRWVYCYNSYLRWHAHYRWERVHRWDQCNWRRF